MFPAKLYSTIYLYVIVILTIGCIIWYSQLKEDRVLQCNKKSNPIPSIILTILVTLFIGFRPLSGVFVDMMNYNEVYNASQNEYFEFDKNAQNVIFSNLFNYFANNLYEIVIFFFIIAIIYFGCMYWALRKIFAHDTFYALVVYLGAFSTFSYGTNGIKAGAAASIFLLVFAYYRKPLLAALFCLISIGFHHSMILPIVCFVLAYFIKNPKYFFYGWLACLFLSFLHIGAITDFLGSLADDTSAERYFENIEEEWGGKTGFRLDFILYSLPPILIGFWALYKHQVMTRLYQLLLCTYTGINGIWMLCMYIPFNNRIAYLSWFILPILIIYPFLKIKLDTRQYVQLNYVVCVYLLFTILIH